MIGGTSVPVSRPAAPMRCTALLGSLFLPANQYPPHCIPLQSLVLSPPSAARHSTHRLNDGTPRCGAQNGRTFLPSPQCPPCIDGRPSATSQNGTPPTMLVPRTMQRVEASSLRSTPFFLDLRRASRNFPELMAAFFCPYFPSTKARSSSNFIDSMVASPILRGKTKRMASRSRFLSRSMAS